MKLVCVIVMFCKCNNFHCHLLLSLHVSSEKPRNIIIIHVLLFFYFVEFFALYCIYIEVM